MMEDLSDAQTRFWRCPYTLYNAEFVRPWPQERAKCITQLQPCKSRIWSKSEKSAIACGRR